jgi:membrane protein YqaA with SNARE-associated domain
MFDFSATTGLVGLALASFLGATLLPGGSELVLLGVLYAHPEQFWTALAIATVANTLGSMTSYLIGRLVPNRANAQGIERVRRYGYPALLFAWLPFVGDALPLAAGWLRLEPWRSLAFIAAGKFARYLVVAGAASWFFGA